jgi:hypothetical protein
MHFWKLVPKRCGQLFHTKHLAVQHYVGELYFLLFIGGGVCSINKRKGFELLS